VVRIDFYNWAVDATNRGPAMAPETFGSRFLAEFRRLGGSTSGRPDTAVTLLKEADRGQFIDARKKASPRTAAQLAIMAHTAEPENLAKRAVEQRKPNPAGPGPILGID
jgi:hypothetical protein